MTVFRSDGVKVRTLTPDQPGSCPLLCQLLGALCYSPGLCSTKRLLVPHRPGAQTVLGALWIITGLLQVALGIFTVYISPYMGYFLMNTSYFPVWMGSLFLVLGLVCVLAERRPRPLYVLLSGLLNLFGVVLAIAALALLTFGIEGVWYKNNCSEYDGSLEWNSFREERLFLERCRQARELRWNLMSSVERAAVLLFVLDLCIGLSSAIISFKTLKLGGRESGTKALTTETKKSEETKENKEKKEKKKEKKEKKSKEKKTKENKEETKEEKESKNKEEKKETKEEKETKEKEETGAKPLLSETKETKETDESNETKE